MAYLRTSSHGNASKGPTKEEKDTYHRQLAAIQRFVKGKSWKLDKKAVFWDVGVRESSQRK